MDAVDLRTSSKCLKAHAWNKLSSPSLSRPLPCMPQTPALLQDQFFFSQEGDSEDGREKNEETKIKYYVFFYQEKFLEVRADYRFNMYLKFLYGKDKPWGRAQVT